MRLQYSIFFFFSAVLILTTGIFLSPVEHARSAKEVVIEAVDEPAGILRRLSGDSLLGGPPKMPDQIRRTQPAGIRIETVAEDLTVPWGMVFTADGSSLYVSERSGNILRIDMRSPEHSVHKLFESEAVLHRGEGGLMDLAADPKFKPGTQNNNSIYFCETYGRREDARNRVRKLTLADSNTVKKAETLLDNLPAGAYHNGCRLVFGPEGYLYVTTGDAGNRKLAQDTTSFAGKLLRMKKDGTPAAENPFHGQKAAPYVYAYGLRNSQGLAWHPENNTLYATDHGPSGEFGVGGNDEINLIVKGGNYGW
ncbi:MAG: PQQ-dependent sugar dehydrogenase, partial [bacterium]